MSLREDANFIIEKSLAAVLPDAAVKKALRDFDGESVYVVAVGKAAWQMASVAGQVLGGRVRDGVVITKYGHVMGDIPGMTCYEAGHPVVDESSISAAKAAVSMVSGLSEKDTVLLLISGGGSALFELPLIELSELQDISKQLLACGADIVEINTLRKRLSAVKGGRFGKLCEPAKVFSIVLSDIIGSPLSMIASGPACVDASSCKDALEIVEKYNLKLSEAALAALRAELPKELPNVETRITGSVSELCLAAAAAAVELGYEPLLLTDCMDCEAKEAGFLLGSIGRSNAASGRKLAYIAGGETVVKLCEDPGLGGRNQELALAAADRISGCKNVCVFSLGSDGTDGPTDAAGGIVLGSSRARLSQKGIEIDEVLQRNDAYNALKAIDGLIITGPTGTNVNDVSVVLIG